MAQGHLSSDEVQSSYPNRNDFANHQAVLHSIDEDDREEATERPRIRLPHTKAPYVH
jgi:hypothetical protein